MNVWSLTLIIARHSLQIIQSPNIEGELLVTLFYSSIIISHSIDEYLLIVLARVFSFEFQEEVLK